MELKIGDEAPDFVFSTTNGDQSNLHSIRGKKIIFFFPKAFTPGCTRESISIQENYQDLKQLGVDEVFGISLDKQEKLNKFCSSYNFEYKMVSDDDRKISKSYGVYRNRILLKFADRDTFIVNRDNKIKGILRNGLTGRKSKLGLHNQGIEIKNYLEQNQEKI